MKRNVKIIIASFLIMLTFSSTVFAAAATAAIDAGKELASKVDIEDVKAVTAETAKQIANGSVEKGKDLIDKLDTEYGYEIGEAEKKTKSLWDSFVEWIKEAFQYIMHLFLFDSKTNLIDTLNDGIEKQNKDATGLVLDDITNIANNRVANAELENLNISSIDRVTTKLPKVEKKKKETKSNVKEEKQEEIKEETKEKKTTEDILKEAMEKTKAASSEDIKEGAKTITEDISKIGENIEAVGDALNNLEIPDLSNLLN